ncbi:MAG: RNB domain-containing ribonuclease [Methanomicrobiales archaeon]|nr:RNB domain-containing ribonuclease [Methanomicrobiales archaeon]
MRGSRRRIDLKAIARRAMERYGFLPAFPPEVLHEAELLREDVQEFSGDTRDLRPLLWSSIDNIDSEDLDQIEYCEQSENGGVRVLVAIADVDHYVKKGTAIDRHALANGTSVYLGFETFPMLPDRLSKGVSSLLPLQDRHAIVIEFAVMQDGELNFGGIYPALVRNKAKLVYEEIGEWLEGKSGIPDAVRTVHGLEEQLRLQAEVAEMLRHHRMAQGALDLETLEPVPVVEGGEVRSLVLQEQNTARRIIEELMVAANRTMVHFLGQERIPMLQRIVRVPKNWAGIVETAARYGFGLPERPEAKALARFLDERRRADPERFPDLSLAIVKLMGPGEYVPFVPGEIPIGHFALQVREYTHSTAPNRRYVDIVNQRLIKSLLAGTPLTYSTEELDELAAHLTDRDKSAEKAARFARKVAAAILLEDRIGDAFEGIVTGAAEKGTYTRILDPPAEGRVVENERGLRVGDRILVRLLRTLPEEGFIDFACVRKVENHASAIEIDRSARK